MKFVPTLLMAMLGFCGISFAAEPAPIAMVMHGGAGTILKKNMTPEAEKAYREKLEEALRTGYTVLSKGGSSLDAVEASIRVLEDSPLFNAGKGAVFTHEGRNELDSSIMDGKSMNAGAVADVTIIKHPISAARAVMEKSPHVMLAGKGAELFATEQGLEIVDPSYFWTESRWKSLQNILIKERQEKENKSGSGAGQATLELKDGDHEFGTVGAVAVDRNGNIAAGTSTGGLTNKMYGRIGDSPIIGAGTYADNRTCGVSSTGTGEYFIRWHVASRISDLMELKGLSVDQAARQVIDFLTTVGGDGGVIAMDAKGNISMPFNTEGMYRGYIRADGTPHVFIYGDQAKSAKP
ncbi:MAG: isoaspartyl peptidase/L-asparaginase [Thermoanaerobaculia bacterium]